jgi:hypothetical protein
MDYERMWKGLKEVFGLLMRISGVNEGFAKKALDLMGVIENDEIKRKEKESNANG